MANSRLKCKHKSCGKYEYREQGVFDNRSSKRFFCSIDCMVKQAALEGAKKAEKAIRQAEMQRKKEIVAKDKQARKKKAEFKDNDRKHQLKITQPVFNRMRVLQELKWFKDHDQDPTCISCGKQLGGDQWCCGHFKSQGSNSALRFDPKNTFLQHNQRCNMRLSGDIAGTKNTRGYRHGLIERFGKEQGQAILDYCDSHNEPVTYSCEWLIQFRKECNAEIRRLQKELEG